MIKPNKHTLLILATIACNILHMFVTIKMSMFAILILASGYHGGTMLFINSTKDIIPFIVKIAITMFMVDTPYVLGSIVVYLVEKDISRHRVATKIQLTICMLVASAVLGACLIVSIK